MRELFQAWDEHASHVHYISFCWLTDLPPASVNEFSSYYGLQKRAFGEYLRTLGLRTYPGSGADKKAFEVLRHEASLRGW